MTTYDRGGSTQPQVAARFGVSLGLVKKLLRQRRRTGQLAPLGHRGGRRPKVRQTHLRRRRALVRKPPDLTLEPRRAATGLACSLVAIHRALVKLGLTYKKDAPCQRAGPPRRSVGKPGVAAASGCTLPDLELAVAAALQSVTAQDAEGW